MSNDRVFFSVMYDVQIEPTLADRPHSPICHDKVLFKLLLTTGLIPFRVRSEKL